jgi:hypothetical protein
MENLSALMQFLDSSVCTKAINLKSISHLQSAFFDMIPVIYNMVVYILCCHTNMDAIKGFTHQMLWTAVCTVQGSTVSQIGTNGEHIYFTVSERKDTATNHYIAHLKYIICRVLPQVEKYWLLCSIL